MPNDNKVDTNSSHNLRRVLRIDRAMTRIIKVGGVMVIGAVVGICFFIFWQILPLFGSAKMTYDKSVDIKKGHIQAVGIDEWGEMPWVLTGDNFIRYVTMDNAKVVQDFSVRDFLSQDEHPVHYRLNAAESILAVCSNQSKCYFLELGYSSSFENDKREIKPYVEMKSVLQLEDGSQVRALDFAGNSDDMIVALLVDYHDGTRTEIFRGKKKEITHGRW